MTVRDSRARGLDMLSLKQCRKILGEEILLTEEELQELRGQLYDLAGVVVDAAQNMPHLNCGGTDFKNILDFVPDEDREETEERAAILEFDAGFSRDRAERLALTNVFKLKGENGSDRNER